MLQQGRICWFPQWKAHTKKIALGLPEVSVLPITKPYSPQMGLPMAKVEPLEMAWQ